MAGFLTRSRLAAKAAIGVFAGKVDPARLGMLQGISRQGYSPRRGTDDLLKAYSESPWLRAVNAKISFGVASARWQLYVTRKAGQTARNAAMQRAGYAERKAWLRKQVDLEDAQEIESHPLLTLLSDANGYHTGIGLRKLTQTHLDLVGEAFWIKERANGGITSGLPVGLWPIPPTWVQKTPKPDRRSYQISFSGFQAEVPDTEVLWFCDLDPANPYGRGTGTGYALGDELDTDEYASKYTKQFFLNGASPDFLVFPKSGGLTDANVKRLEEQWNQQHQGFWRRFKGHFLSREIGVHEFGGQADFRALQMAELRKAERDTIIQVYGTSPEMLGIVAGADRAHAEAAEAMFGKFVLVPRLEFLRATLQERLVPEFDDRLILDYESPVEADREYNLRVAQAAPWSLQVDEWREMQDKEPLDADEGQIFMVPAAILPSETLSGATPMPAPAPIPSPRQPALPAAAHLDPVEAKAYGDDAAIFRLAGDGQGTEDVRRMLTKSPEDLPAASAVAARLEPRFRQRFLAAVAVAKRDIDVEQLAREIAKRDLGRIEDAAQTDVLAAELEHLVPNYRQAYLSGARVANETLASAGVGLSFDLINPQAVTWAATTGATRLTVVMDETREAVRQIVADAFTEGWDARKTAQMIKDSGLGLNRPQQRAWFNFAKKLEEQGVSDATATKRLTRYAEAQLRQRSMLVARTEMLSASNAGQDGLWHEARRQGAISDETTKREWIVAPDDRLCEEVCEPMDGQLRGLDEPFTTGINEEIDRPPAHPRCRCAMSLRFVEPSKSAQRTLLQRLDDTFIEIQKGQAEFQAKMDAALRATRVEVIEKKLIRDERGLSAGTVETRRTQIEESQE